MCTISILQAGISHSITDVWTNNAKLLLILHWKEEKKKQITYNERWTRYSFNLRVYRRSKIRFNVISVIKRFLLSMLFSSYKENTDTHTYKRLLILSYLHFISRSFVLEREGKKNHKYFSSFLLLFLVNFEHANQITFGLYSFFFFY